MATSPRAAPGRGPAGIRRRAQSRFWWANVVRGTVALALAGIILAYPSSQPMLVNYLGLFMVLSNVALLKSGLTGGRARGLWLLAGGLGVFGGLLILARDVLFGVANDAAVRVVLGCVLIAVGGLRWAGVATEPEPAGLGQKRTSPARHGVYMGVLEIVMGLLVLLLPALGPGARLILASWALVAGVTLLSEGLRQRGGGRAAGGEAGSEG